MADPKKDIRDVNTELGNVENTLISIADTLSTTIKRAIEDVKDESKSVAEVFEKNLQKAIKDVAKNSDVIVANQLKIASGAAKTRDIERQILSNNVKREALIRTIDNLKKSGVKIDKNTVQLQVDALSAIEDQNKVLQIQQSEITQIQKKLGTTGNILKGISKIPILGNLINAEEALIASQREAAQSTSTSTSVMKAAFKSLGGSLKSNLTDPTVKFGLAIKFLSVVVKIFGSIDAAAGQMAKSIGISYDNALKLNEELRDTAVNSKVLGVNFKEISEAQIRLSEEFGIYSKISDKVLVTQSQLTKLIGLSEQESTNILKTSSARGVENDKFVKQIYGANTLLNIQNKTFISEKAVMKEISTTSNAIKMSIKGGTDQLVKSVQEAKKLGVNLNQLDQIAGSLLNFEDSISAELEAELLTGKNLNLEKARLYALNNDLVGVSKELSKQNITAEKFSRMNRIQQEAIARSMGMSRESMADMFTEQKSLSELQKSASYRDVKSLKDAEEKFRQRSKEVGTAKALEELGNSEFAAKQKTLSAQESFNESMIRLGDIIKKVVDGPMGQMLSKINSLVDKILKIPGVEKIVGFVGGAGLLVGTAASLLTVGKSFIGKPSGRPNDPIYTVGGSGGGMTGGTPTTGGGLTGNFKRAKTAFTKGGLKGGFKSLGRIGKTALKGARGAGLIGTGVGLAADLMDNGLSWEGLGRAGITGLGSLAGGALGSLVAPGVGTVAGGIGGGMAGDWLGDKIFGERTEMATGGIVSKPTRALVGEAGTEAVIPLDKFYAKLDELISVAKTGGNVYIDSTKAGTAFGIGTYKTQ